MECNISTTSTNSMAPVAQITESSSVDLHSTVNVKSAVIHLSKFARASMSPEEFSEYKKKRKNQKQKDAHEKSTQEIRSQTLATRALKKRVQRKKQKTDGEEKPRKPKPYQPIQDKSPVKQEKQRASWKNCKARGRHKRYAQLEAAADSDARRQVVELQVKLENAKYNLYQSSDSSSKEILSLQSLVDTCCDDLASMQHLVDCHRDAPYHDVYGVSDCDVGDGIDKVGSDYNVSDEVGSDEVCSNNTCASLVGKSGVSQKMVNSFSDVVVCSGEVCIIDVCSPTAGRGTITQSVITLDDDEFDCSSQTTIPSSLFRDQKLRFVSATDRVLGLSPHSPHWWESSDSRRGIGDWPSEVIEIAQSRANKLSCTKPTNCQESTAWRRVSFPKICDTLLSTLVTSLVTFKNMDDPGDGSITNTMTSRDFSRLLTTGGYLTDSSIYMYSALLLERDHAMSRTTPSWKRSWIYGSHFYTLLVPNRNQYNYERVKKYGTRQVPGNSRKSCFMRLPACVSVLPEYI
jgi:hypothetical protein